MILAEFQKFKKAITDKDADNVTESFVKVSIFVSGCKQTKKYLDKLLAENQMEIVQ